MMKDTLKAMLQPFGPSGCEGPIADAIAAIIKPYVDETRTDAMGNLIAVKHGPGKKIMFSSHMDQIGYIVLDADKEGFLRVSNIGGIYVANAAFRHVVFANGVPGVICSEPTGDKPSMNKLYIDIGADSRDAALEKVPVGTTAVVQYQFTDMGDQVCAPYMDDRAACAVQVELLKALPDKPKNEIIAVFSTQEEVGCRGALTAAYAMEPDIGVAIDVTPAGDVPKCDPPLPMKLGKGPCVKVKDSHSISTPLVRDGLVEAAKKAGIAFQYEVLPYGGTDAGAIMLTKAGIPAGTLSIPCRYVHSPVESVSIRDMEECVKVLRAYAEEVV